MKLKNARKAQIITRGELQAMRRVLPVSLSKAAGILRGEKRKAIERHINTVRLEWDRMVKV